MNSVTRTNPAKIEMLTAGSPMVPLSAAMRSDTGGPLGVGGPRTRLAVGVVLEALPHLVGDRVGALVGVRHVEVGDHERRDELAEPQQEPDVHVAEDLGGHE